MNVNLKNKIAGIEFESPILGASGTFGYGLLYDRFYDISAIGGFVTKGLSLEPRPGNPAPRICETPGGMLNAIGLQNIGFQKFTQQKMPKLRGRSVKVIANFFGDTIEEYRDLAALLGEVEGLSGLEMNISCPNRNKRGEIFGASLKTTEQVVKTCREATNMPLIVKLSPNVADIAAFAKVCEDNGADGLSIINTISGMAIDIHTRKPVLANIMGGLSGPAIKPIALRMVWQCYKAVKIPIFGIGGVSNTQDVVEFFLAGASAVQIGSMNFVEPDICKQVVDGLPELLDSMGVSDYREIIGAAH
ncbi:Dihydroorotate dehydrogenase (NAD(+)), catalytic subunit [hydrothermal vent metagenome]|uniref:Dihydroorotate dehydrogenase (NAD(+)), catalytic subunit n=1 Tax=hydrothermal vent metagenome TaxID=652676 RepID=A0A3B1C3R6_9ZZZZ